MRRGTRLSTAGVAVTALTVSVLSAQEPTLTPEQMGEFLQTAEVVASRQNRRGRRSPGFSH